MSGPIPRYVDTVAVERACKGDRAVPLNRSEMAAAFDHLRARGHSNAQVATILGVRKRTVERWRAAQSFPLSRTTSGRLAERRGLAVGKAS